MLTIFTCTAAVNLTTSSAANDDKFVIITTFSFQWYTHFIFLQAFGKCDDIFISDAVWNLSTDQDDIDLISHQRI